MAHLIKRLKSHDWYHAYSDDHRVWRAGSNSQRKLTQELSSLKCPHAFWDIHKALFGMILEDFEEDDKGGWYRKGNRPKYVAPARKEDLITRAHADTIVSWLEENDGGDS